MMHLIITYFYDIVIIWRITYICMYLHKRPWDMNYQKITRANK